MPLSKARMRARKKADRAKSGFDKQLSPLTGANDVKPESPVAIPKPLIGTPWIDDIAEFVGSAAEDGTGIEYIDADGYPVYEEGQNEDRKMLA